MNLKYSKETEIAFKRWTSKSHSYSSQTSPEAMVKDREGQIWPADCL
jgi:hypothetical protein